ncbi:immunoglobulin-like domain-containing protein [Macrococcus sp. DPC7161]|uniref:immunoglobulin-like domain-containing protein n=1 Tax=Macrococcus sp. DPC7161 TaxID=2507060 RepID=UPI00100BAAFD|nr:immunoglobulin-like domain-containing protein [Macrococcus sp. DPC7161]RXK17498.1 DUF5011 domain-containing protein [Macrococcus sp. DPC7161]
MNKKHQSSIQKFALSTTTLLMGLSMALSHDAQAETAPSYVPKITNTATNTLAYGSTFNPLTGITATDTEDGNITSKVVVVSNNVNTKVAGTYTVVYQVTDSNNNTFKLTRTIVVSAPVVANTAPVFKFTATSALTVGNAFNPLTGVTATDVEDGDLTSKIVIVSNNVNTQVAGAYQVTYEVKDSKGTTARYIRNVSVSAVNNPPKIVSTGSNNLLVGATFNPLTGVTATDTEDGVITPKLVIVSNNVNTQVAGTYQVVYSVTDSKGNKANFTRNILVSGVNTAPKFASSASNNLTVGATFNPLTGVSATDAEDGNITAKIVVVSNNVNTQVAGTYQVVYKVTDSRGVSSTLTRNVLVSAPVAANNAPKITNTSSNTLTLNSVFNPLAGITAVDTEDGNITAKVVVVSNNVNTKVAGTYQVVYKVTDTKGSSYTLNRSVTVIPQTTLANTPPKITNTASNNLKLGATFNALTGVTATDAEDGNITAKIVVVSNTVNTKIAGTYQVVYKVTDAMGNSYTLTRNVLVSA